MTHPVDLGPMWVKKASKDGDCKRCQGSGVETLPAGAKQCPNCGGKGKMTATLTAEGNGKAIMKEASHYVEAEGGLIDEAVSEFDRPGEESQIPTDMVGLKKGVLGMLGYASPKALDTVFEIIAAKKGIDGKAKSEMKQESKLDYIYDNLDSLDQEALSGVYRALASLD